MKPNVCVAWLALSLLLFTGCKKFLDQVPDDRITM